MSTAPRAALSLALLAALAAGESHARLLPSALAQDGKGQGGKKGDAPKKDPPKEDPPKKGGEKDGEKAGEKAGEKDGEKDGKKGGKKDGNRDGTDEAKKALSEGDEVKQLTLDLLEGGSWTASAARGKTVVLVFASASAGESVDALKTLGDPKGKTAQSGATVLGVLRDADAGQARRTVKENSLTVTLALDPKRKAYDRLARVGLPWTVIIDRNGKIALSSSGFDDGSVAKKVEALARK